LVDEKSGPSFIPILFFCGSDFFSFLNHVNIIYYSGFLNIMLSLIAAMIPLVQDQILAAELAAVYTT